MGSKAIKIYAHNKLLEQGKKNGGNITMSMIGNLVAVPQAKLDDLYKNPENISDVLYEELDDEIIDLDKTWQAIHFMLTGSEYEGEFPLSNVIFGVEAIGEEDVGYGPALGTPVEVVKEICAALDAISTESFCTKFNPEGMLNAGIYPDIWDEEGILEEYILPSFKALKTFYSESVQKNYAVITFIS